MKCGDLIAGGVGLVAAFISLGITETHRAICLFALTLLGGFAIGWLARSESDSDE